MKLPRFIATGGVRETGLVRAQDIGALTNVGDAEFRAIQQAGAAIGSVADDNHRAFMQRKDLDNRAAEGRANARSVDALTEGTVAINGMDFSLNTTLPNNPKDYWDGNKLLEFPTEDKIKVRDEQLKVYAGRIQSLSKAMGFRGEKARKAWVNDKLNSGIEHFTKVSNAKQWEYQEQLYIGNAREAASNGNIEIANEWIKIAEKSGLIGAKQAAETRTDLMKEFFQNSAVRDAEATVAIIQDEVEARKTDKGAIPKDIMTDAELHQSLNTALTIQKEKIVAFENDINSKLVAIDNTPDMPQRDFDAQAKMLKTDILLANIPGIQKRKMLSDLERWRRGTNEIDYARILALNQEMDAAQRSGIVDPTIEARITNANLEGAFGGRNKGGQKNYGILIRRFKKLKFDERIQATVSIVNNFERENRDDPRLIFLFHQAKNKIITEKPDASTRELFIEISALAEAYSVLPESTIIQEMRGGEAAPKPQEVDTDPPPGTIPSTKQLEADLKTKSTTDKRIRMVNPKGVVFRVIAKDVEKKRRDGWVPLVTVTTQTEYDKLPSGTQYIDANGVRGVKP